MINPLARQAQTAYSGGLYKYLPGEIFNPGSQSLAFQPRFTLPILNPFGSSVLAGNGPAPYQPPQVFSQMSITPSGIGGNLAGQLYTQGLIEE